MKNLVFLFVVVFIGYTAFAGDPVGRNYKFDKAFERALEANDTITGPEKIVALGPKLDEFIKEYPRDWRTYYWKSYSEMVASQALFDKAKMDRLDSATKYLDRAEYLIKNNSECQILRAFILHERILANPEKNEAKYGKDMEFYKNYAYRSNQSNPRYLLLEGIIHINDTVGKPQNLELAKNYFKGADYLYKNEARSKFAADPFWGQQRTELYVQVFGLSDGSESFDEQIMNELEEDIDDKQVSVADREEDLKKKGEKEKSQLEKNVDKVDKDIEKLDEDLKEDKKDKKSKKKKEKKKKKSKKDKK